MLGFGLEATSIFTRLIPHLEIAVFFGEFLTTYSQSGIKSNLKFNIFAKSLQITDIFS